MRFETWPELGPLDYGNFETGLQISEENLLCHHILVYKYEVNEIISISKYNSNKLSITIILISFNVESLLSVLILNFIIDGLPDNCSIFQIELMVNLKLPQCLFPERLLRLI